MPEWVIFLAAGITVLRLIYLECELCEKRQRNTFLEGRVTQLESQVENAKYERDREQEDLLAQEGF